MRRHLALCQRILETRSVSRDGDEALANLLVGMMTDSGIKASTQLITHSIDGVSKRQFNALGILGDPLVDRKMFRGLLLTSHVDTSPVIPRAGAAPGQPMAEVRDGRVWGSGAVSGKVDFLCKILATEKFREKKLKMPVYLAATCLGELGLLGTRYLIKSLAFNPKFVAVGSPTGLKLGTAQKSQSRLRIAIQFQPVERDSKGFNRRLDIGAMGQVSHASFPESGQNAVVDLAEFLGRTRSAGFELRLTEIGGGQGMNQVPDRAFANAYLKSTQFEDFKDFYRQKADPSRNPVELGGVGDQGVRFLPDSVLTCFLDLISFLTSTAGDYKSPSDPAFAPPFTTLSVTQLKQSASSLDLWVDGYSLPTADKDALFRTVQSGVQSIASRFPDLNLSVTEERSLAPLYATTRHPDWIRLAEEALAAVPLERTPAPGSLLSDASMFSDAGFPTICFGPGEAVLSHTSEESVAEDHLERAILFYTKLIERVCL